eukprot:6203429-Pleurochrysis_carterae.AAC.3
MQARSRAPAPPRAHWRSRIETLASAGNQPERRERKALELGRSLAQVPCSRSTPSVRRAGEPLALVHVRLAARQLGQVGGHPRHHGDGLLHTARARRSFATGWKHDGALADATTAHALHRCLLTQEQQCFHRVGEHL